MLRSAALAIIALASASVPADYTVCTPVITGPITPRTPQQPFRRQPDAAAYGYGTPYFDGWPPTRFQKDTEAYVRFVTPTRIDAACGERHSATYPLEACQSGKIIVLPNPCGFSRSEVFARLTCHEAAHLSGWPGDHPK